MTSLASTRPSGTPVALGALIVGAVAMGWSPIAVRLADVGPLASAFWRVFLALPVLWVWMRASEVAEAAPFRFTRPTVLAGLAFAGDLLFWHLSIARTTVANATFFATMAPLWVVVFGWLLFRERVGAAVLAGLGLCLVGGILLVCQSLRFAPNHVPGDIDGMVTGVFFGLYFLAVRAARGAGIGAGRVTFEATVVTAVVLLVAAVSLETSFLPRSTGGWGAVLTLAVVSHAGGQGLLSFALGILPTVFSSLVIFLEAIAAAIAGYAILGETISLLQAGGGALIVAGIWVARPRRRASPYGPKPLPVLADSQVRRDAV